MHACIHTYIFLVHCIHLVEINLSQVWLAQIFSGSLGVPQKIDRQCSPIITAFPLRHFGARHRRGQMRALQRGVHAN